MKKKNLSERLLKMNLHFKIFAFYAFFVFFSLIFYREALSAEQSYDAPFGLTWGMTIDEVKELGVNLETLENYNDKNAFLATGLSKAISDLDAVLLNFGYNDRLFEIRGVSDVFQNDPYAFALKKRYDELSQILENKYGNKKETHFIDKRLYTEPDEFLVGIERGRSYYFTTFSNSEIEVNLSINAISRDSANYLLIYEHKQYLDENNQKKKEREKSSL